MARFGTRRRVGQSAGALLLVAAVLLLHTDTALAKMSAARTATAAYTTASLAPPTGLRLTKTCTTRSTSTVTLAWTATSSAYATGYLMTYTKNGSSTGTTPQPVTGRTTTSATYTITNGISYNLTLASTYRSWTSQTNPSTGAFTC